jgi:hypothetical protein
VIWLLPAALIGCTLGLLLLCAWVRWLQSGSRVSERVLDWLWRMKRGKTTHR